MNALGSSGMAGDGPSPNDMMEKRSLKDTARLISRISRLVFTWKKECIILIITVILTICCQLTIPILVERAINCLIYRKDSTFVQELTIIIASLITVFVLNSIIEYIKNISAMRLSENLSMKMRDELFERVIYAPLSFLDKHSYGDLMSRLTNDSQRVSTVAQVFETFVSTIVLIVGCGIIMILKSWKLALISVATAVITTLISGLISGKMRSYFMKQSISLGTMNSHLEETVKNFKTMEVLGISRYATELMDEKSRKYTDVCIKSSVFSGIINPIMLILGNLSFMITVVVGGHLAISRLITIGALQAVIMYSKQFMDNVYSFGNIMIQTQSFLASAERVFAIYDLKGEDQENKAISENRSGDSKIARDKAVVFDKVSFSYDGVKQVLKNVSIELEPGELSAIVGATGAGKTTLISLLLRFYDDYEGNIYINGVDLKDYSISENRNLVTVVLQDSKIIEGTVLDNILYGAGDIFEGKTDSYINESVEQLIDKMNIRSFIDRLPSGLETETSDDDKTMSEGIRQIIGLARAAIRNPKILILDEALSAVDAATEQSIRSGIMNLRKDSNTLLIAHRLETIMDADRILVMKDGSVIEDGPAKALLAQEGEFKRLYTSQMAGQET